MRLIREWRISRIFVCQKRNLFLQRLQGNRGLFQCLCKNIQMRISPCNDQISTLQSVQFFQREFF